MIPIKIYDSRNSEVKYSEIIKLDEDSILDKLKECKIDYKGCNIKSYKSYNNENILFIERGITFLGNIDNKVIEKEIDNYKTQVIFYNQSTLNI